MNSSELVVALSKCALFKTIELPALERLADIASTRCLARGNTLFWAGDKGDRLFILKQGTIKIFRTDPDGRNRTLRLLGPGEVLGEMALFDATPRSASAVAMTDCVIIEIGSDDFGQLLHDYPAVAVQMLAVLAQRIRMMNRQVESLTFLGVPERLELCLMHLATENGLACGESWVKIAVHLTHEELAQLVGSSRETVTRALKEMEKTGRVRQSGKHLLVSKNSIASNRLHDDSLAGP